VSRPVSLSFTTPHGGVVPVDRVEAVQLAGGGRTLTVSGEHLREPVSLLAAQANFVDGALTPHEVTYSIASVKVDGSDAVFAGRQRFNPAQASHWPISVSMFDVHVTVSDVLFGGGVTSGAEVTRPDGVSYGVRFDGGRPTLLRSLVRGDYILTTDSAVLGARSRLLVNKNMNVELRVITVLDVLVLFLLMLAVSTSLVVLGRRWARSHA
jgi:hypothetical protein